MRKLIVWISIAGIVLAGCAKDEPVADDASKAQEPAKGASTAPKSSEGGEDLTALEAAQKKTADALTANSNDAAAKKAHVEATVKLATATMLAPELAPREKYPKALKLYREALKLDPKNEEALENKQQIEDIYKSMGRPIPQ